MHKTKYLLIGGGTSVAVAATEIRKIDSDGSIAIVGKESRKPYDRPPLSKNFLTNPKMQEDDPESKMPEFYAENKISLFAGDPVVSIDQSTKIALTASGESFQYEKALIATGSTPKRLNVPGSDHLAIHTLRTLDDAVKIRSILESVQKVVIVGSGFIGIEVAASLNSLGKEVTVIEHSLHAWPNITSNTSSKWVQNKLEADGIHFLFKATISAFEPAESKVVVVTDTQMRLEADLVIVAIGVTPTLDLAQSAGAEVAFGGVLVDEHLETTLPGIYATGDIAAYPDPVTKVITRLEHHLGARGQAAVAGKNMAGKTEEVYDSIPYFWSDAGNVHMVYRGNAAGSQLKALIGDPVEDTFVEFTLNSENEIIAALILSTEEKLLDPISDKIEPLLIAKTPISAIEKAHIGIP